MSPTTQFSSPSVDVVKTVWSTTPFASLAANDTATTGVFELTVRDSVSGVDVVLNATMDPTTSRQLPVHFWMAVGGSGTSARVMVVLMFVCKNDDHAVLFTRFECADGVSVLGRR